MSGLIGHHRTRARRAVEALSAYDVAVVARLLSMRRHTIALILSRRMRPGPRFAAAVTRVTNPA